MHAARAVRRLLVGALVTGAVLAWAGSASAVSIDPNPILFDNGQGVTGTITLTQVSSGRPAGGSDPGGASNIGTVDPSDVSLVFEVFVDTGLLDSVGLSVSSGPPDFNAPTRTGAGDVPDGGVDVTAISPSGTSGAVFEFQDGGGTGTLGAGETSDPFYISYESVAADGSLTASFMISPDPDSDLGGDFTETTSIIPEPGTLALFSLGLAGLGWSSRRGLRG